MAIISNLNDIFLNAAPWLLLGLLAAGAIKAYLPDDLLTRWLGGEGIWPITKAAVIGAPLPLCSCGVLPAAISLRRNGASRSATVSFLIATPETGVDSIVFSYALLGPVMAVLRPVAAIFSAIFTGMLTVLIPHSYSADSHSNTSHSCSGEHADHGSTQNGTGILNRTYTALHYGLVEMVDDLVLWLSIGLLLAALMQTWLPPMFLADWGSGLPAMLLMLLVGIPMYICATASTPIAAALLLTGISPGTVLVFLLAGPATNIATIGIIYKEMGKAVLIMYLLGISISSIVFGLVTDALLTYFDIDILGQISNAEEWLPDWLMYLSASIFLIAALMSLSKMFRRKLTAH